MGEEFLRAAVAFLVVVDPIGNILTFEAVAGEVERRKRVGIAALAVAVAAGLIVVFAVGGNRVLEVLDISPESFQIAAGVLLVLPAIRLVERGALVEPPEPGAEPGIDAAIVPLALPMLAGPGALALATSYGDQFGVGITLAAAAIALAAAFAAFLATSYLVDVVHEAGLRAASRVVGVLLMAIAVDFIVTGWNAVQTNG